MIKQENTYLGADGLAYCKICGEPVEAYFPLDSILYMPFLLLHAFDGYMHIV